MKKAAKSSKFAQAAAAAGLVSSPGKSAVKASYQSGISLKPGFTHSDSIDLDSHFQQSEPNAHRWDYGLGLRAANGKEFAVWIEPHPASSTGEVSRVIAKLQWLKSKLGSQSFSAIDALNRSGQTFTTLQYRWLAQTGSIAILPTSKEARQLALHGIDQPRRHVQVP